MANAELLLLKPVENLGNEGDTVSVKSGYARNFLLPHGLAIPVTRANRKQMESLKDRAEKRKAAELESAQALAGKLEGLQLNTDWVQEALEKSSASFTSAIHESKETESSNKITEISAALDALVSRAAQTYEIEEHRLKVVLPAIKTAAEIKNS